MLVFELKKRGGFLLNLSKDYDADSFTSNIAQGMTACSLATPDFQQDVNAGGCRADILTVTGEVDAYNHQAGAVLLHAKATKDGQSVILHIATKADGGFNAINLNNKALIFHEVISTSATFNTLAGRNFQSALVQDSGGMQFDFFGVGENTKTKLEAPLKGTFPNAVFSYSDEPNTLMFSDLTPAELAELQVTYPENDYLPVSLLYACGIANPTVVRNCMGFTFDTAGGGNSGGGDTTGGTNGGGNSGNGSSGSKCISSTVKWEVNSGNNP